LIIESGLSDMEDYYSAADAQEQAHKGEEKVFSAQAAKKDLGADA
jgi:predicted DNA-binding protein